MKILHTEASPHWGGQEIRILRESQTFIKHGHEVLILADTNSQLASRGSHFNVPTFPIELKKKRIKSLLAIRQQIKNFSPDVVSCHSSTDHWLTALARLTLKNKPAIVRTRHISTPVNRSALTKWLYNFGTDALMTTGVCIREGLIKDNFTKPEKVYSVPTGIDPDIFQVGNILKIREELNLPQSHYIFGIVATLRSWKGHRYLIEAFGKLNKEETTLIIVGDGGELEACQLLAKTMPNAKNILFLGNQKEVAPYLQAMDCFVLPSYADEGVPQAMLQAMAVGLPIISCAIGGIPECLEGHMHKIFVEPKNSTSLSAAMAHQITLENTDRLPRIRYIPFDMEYLYSNSLDVYRKAIEFKNLNF